VPDQSAGGSDLVLSTFTAALPSPIVYRMCLYDLLRYTSTLNDIATIIVCIQWQIKFHLAHQYRVNRLIIPRAGPISICWPGITSKVRYLPITRYNYNFAIYRSINVYVPSRQRFHLSEDRFMVARVQPCLKPAMNDQRDRTEIFKNLFTGSEIFFVSLSPLSIFLNEKPCGERSASHVFESYATLARLSAAPVRSALFTLPVILP